MVLKNYSNNTIYNIIALIIDSNRRYLKTVKLPCNNLTINVVNLLLRSNQICGYRVYTAGTQNYVAVSLRYPENKPKLFSLSFVSKPSRRVYFSAAYLRSSMIKSRSSIFILSSSYGLISGAEALLLNSGGEVICVLN